MRGGRKFNLAAKKKLAFKCANEDLQFFHKQFFKRTILDGDLINFIKSGGFFGINLLFDIPINFTIRLLLSISYEDGTKNSK